MRSALAELEFTGSSASFEWRDDVPHEHQDLILSAFDRLSPASRRRTELYQRAADATTHSSPQQTHAFAKLLVREENERLSRDPHEAHRQRHFTLRKQDEHSGCSFLGYAPAGAAALLKALLDKEFKADRHEEEHRTIPQHCFDAFERVIKAASSARVARTGHAALVVSVTDTAAMDWRTKFASNVGIDLSLLDIAELGGDRIVDYIVVHDHRGAVKQLVTGERTAHFYQRGPRLPET